MDLEQAIASEKFTVKSLTASINTVDVPKTRIAALKLFEERGIRTTSVDIEYKDGKFILVPEKPRGADGTHIDDSQRDIYTFRSVHLPLEASIFADDIQNTRAFGSEDELEPLEALIMEKHEEQRISLDVTLEYHRIGAIFGKILGATGNVIEDLFKRFNITEKNIYHEIDFTKPLRTQLLDVKRASEKNQSGIIGKRYRGFVSPTFFNELLENADFVKAFDRYENSSALRDDVRVGVLWQGIYWEEFMQDVNGTEFMKEGEAVVFPEDKPGLFLTRFSPANYNETVNTIGLPYYSKSEPKRMGKGVDLESQSNPINVCTSPLAVRKLRIKSA
jgi:hypothetical protein